MSEAATTAEEGEATEEQNESSQGSGENRGGHRRGDRRRSRQKHNRPAQTQQQSESSLNLAELRELAELINEQGFTDFEFENEKIRVRLRRELAPQIIHASSTGGAQASQQFATQPLPPQTMQSVPPLTAAASSVESAPAKTQIEPAVSEDENLYKITSPIVGTFYRAPSPEAEPFVKIGSQVTPDSVVCIVEAMKLMNEIQAETTGEIVKIYVENGQPIEYGQPLFGVKK